MQYNVMEIPDVRSGDWEIDTLDISYELARILSARSLLHYNRGAVQPGKYKRLRYKEQIVMSNTPDEMADHSKFIQVADGEVLINGLGLGCALAEILNDPAKNIKSVTVIEASKVVIDLVAPYYRNDRRVQILHADAYEWPIPNGQHYNAVWHDIWDEIDSDNLRGMDQLKRKYKSRTKWQACWCRKECLAQRTREALEDR